MAVAREVAGVTLVETLIASSLLVTLLGGVAPLLLLIHRSSARAEQAVLATVAAETRIERLRAVPWEYDLDGVPVESADVAPSPSGTLGEDVDGYFEWLDASGARIGRDAGAPAFVVRWAVVPAGASVRGLEACVFAWPAGDGAAPLVCLASARVRQP